MSYISIVFAFNVALTMGIVILGTRVVDNPKARKTFLIMANLILVSTGLRATLWTFNEFLQQQHLYAYMAPVATFVQISVYTQLARILVTTVEKATNTVSLDASSPISLDANRSRNALITVNVLVACSLAFLYGSVFLTSRDSVIRQVMVRVVPALMAISSILCAFHFATTGASLVRVLCSSSVEQSKKKLVSVSIFLHRLTSTFATVFLFETLIWAIMETMPEVFWI